MLNQLCLLCRKTIVRGIQVRAYYQRLLLWLEAGTETWIVGGGAYHADDKVVQHNGCGTVNVSSIPASISWR